MLFIAYNSRRHPVKMTLPEGEWGGVFKRRGQRDVETAAERDVFGDLLILPPVSAVIMGKENGRSCRRQQR